MIMIKSILKYLLSLMLIISSIQVTYLASNYYKNDAIEQMQEYNLVEYEDVYRGYYYSFIVILFTLLAMSYLIIEILNIYYFEK